MSKNQLPVAIVGGGPAGSTAALCLKKLGREAVVFEKQAFPRYRIGESLLPGTMSILKRLEVFDRIEAADFVYKGAATFVWGDDKHPWTFTFSTPKQAPWVSDHAYQVTRSEYDKILLDAAEERGAEVRQKVEVSKIERGEVGEPVKIHWKDEAGDTGVLDAAYVIDGSGATGIVAKELGLRRYDEYFKNMAVWSYFKGGKRYTGDLAGVTFSVTYEDGWIWIIPLKDDIYSVGVITDITETKKMKKIGIDGFYNEKLAKCKLAQEILEGAKQCDEVRAVREWAYDASELAVPGAFLCGDSACFIDPLFSQGVHLATYSAMLASAGIDHLMDHPDDAANVMTWYDDSYRTAYDRYHQFLSAFYTWNSTIDSQFWTSRRIEGSTDERFKNKDWFTALTGQTMGSSTDADAAGIAELENRTATLQELWSHKKNVIGDEWDEEELSIRRVRYASELLKEFRSMAEIRWAGTEVRLEPSYQVGRTSFKLEHQQFIADETGRQMTTYALTEAHRELFEGLREEPLSYKELTRELKGLEGGQGTAIHIVGRLLELGMLEGRDKDGKIVKVRSALRFGGVGAEDEIS